MNENTTNADLTIGDPADVNLAGRYRVVRQLGQGGMGSVWLAEDTQLDNRPVAIKMLPSILVSNKRAYQQLKSEALVSLRLTHSNIAAVRAFEENDGNPFLVVDYIDGETLDDYLAERGKLPEDEVLRLLRPIAAALDYAHAKGIIHRDVKPGNVMVAKDGTPFVLDFGIAREMQETLTRVTGKLSSGTLMYMSPEQLHGASPTVAQDVYSFAAMAYECLTGQPPFSRGQIEYQIEHDQPAAIDASVGVGKLIMQGLAKSPDNRPVSCGQVLSSEGQKMSRPNARRKWIAVVMGFVVVIAGVGAFVCLRPAERHQELKIVRIEPTNEVREVTAPKTRTEARSAQLPVPVPKAVVPVALPKETRPVVSQPKETARPQSLQPKPTVDVLAKESAAEMARLVAIARSQVATSDRTLADEEWRAAELRYEAGKKSFDAARYAAATNAWSGVADQYAKLKTVAELKRRKQTMVVYRDRVSEVLSQATEEMRRLAGKRLESAHSEFNKGESFLKQEDFAAASNCWRNALVMYGDARNETQVLLQRQRESRQQDERKALLARLAQGSQFLPDPPMRAPGERRSVKLPDGSQLLFVWCPPGRFLMGSPLQEFKRDSGESQHLVTLTKGFWIGQYEVTRAQWKSVMGNARFMLSALVGADGNYPVDEVSWLQCMDFCRRLSQSSGFRIRLPTEAEWEYACRAGTATPFSFGSALNGDRACCAGGEPYGPIGPGSNSYTSTAQVGSYQANPWGIFDMHGNVFEWCADYYGDYPEGDETDPTGPLSGQSRVRRGGCWNFYPSQCRSAFRARWKPEDKASYTGLRVCCDEL